MLQRAHITTIILALVAIPIATLIGFAVYAASYSAVVAFAVAPQESSVSYQSSSQIIRDGDTIRLKPGTYDFTFSKDGFITQVKTVEVKEDLQNVIPVSLTPTSDDAAEELSSDVNITALQGMADITNTYIEEQSATDPTVANLPFSNLLFSIDYYKPAHTDADEPFIIVIDAISIYRYAAMEKLRSMGYNPADYTYEFTDSSNPFEEQGEGK